MAAARRAAVVFAGVDVEQVTLEVGGSSRVGAPAIVTFALGGASIAAGGTLLGLYFAKPELKTTPVEIASIASLSAGGALLGTGTLPVLLRSPKGAPPPPKAARAPAVQVSLGPGSVTLGGQF